MRGESSLVNGGLSTKQSLLGAGGLYQYVGREALYGCVPIEGLVLVGEIFVHCYVIPELKLSSQVVCCYTTSGLGRVFVIPEVSGGIT